ncbi:class 3 lipase protein [Aphelenchoides avenae]|nr:class 3 lipase protein [Aphelenchus avenae]
MLLQLVVACALASLVSGAYDDKFARNQMLYLSAAAYSTTPTKCLTNVIPGANVTKSVVTTCGDSKFAGQCAGFVGVAPPSKAVFLSFRGTSGFVQLVVESATTAFGEEQASPFGGKVSKYFLTIFNKLWNGGLRAELTALKAKYPGYQLWQHFA